MAEVLKWNPAICDGFGYCAEMLPEMIGLDEWGFPMVKVHEVPETLLAAARQAVKFCPRRALALVPAPVGTPRRRSVKGAGQRAAAGSARR